MAQGSVLFAFTLLFAAEPTCEQVLKNVRGALKPHTIAFARADECFDVDAQAKEALASHAASLPAIIGDVDGTRVAVVTSGPGGSGHYWQIGVALDRPGATACINTSTVAWRNVASTGLFPPFEPLGVPHRLQIWISINSVPPDDDAADMAPTMLLLPRLYRLGRGALVLDEAASKTAVRRFAALYAKAATKSSAARLHTVAAAAYSAYAEGRPCP